MQPRMDMLTSLTLMLATKIMPMAKKKDDSGNDDDDDADRDANK